MYCNEYELEKLRRAIRYLSCKVENGITETDPIFEASIASTITQTDINNWNSATTIPNLDQVTSEGNSTTDAIISESTVRAYNGLIVNSNTTSGTIKGTNITVPRNYELPNNSGTIALLSDIPVDTGPQIVRTNAVTYNLVPTKRTILVTFTGTTTTFNLPLVAPNVGTIILLYNGGTGGATITGNVADGNVVIDGGMAGTSSVLTPGSPMTIFNDGFNWITKP